MASFVGVDLGATNVRAAVGDENGHVLATARQSTPRGPTGIAITERVLDTVRAACENADVDPEDVRAAGVGSIGPLDLADGSADSPANIPVGTVPLVGPLSKLLDSERVSLHNDAVAGVIGERFYADRNPDDMAYVTISSGIGAGVAVDGHVLSGWDGNAAEIGHMVVDPQGRQTCGCGRDGHWEAYCSGENIPSYARSLAAAEDGDVETSLPLDDPDFSAKHVFESAGELRSPSNRTQSGDAGGQSPPGNQTASDHADEFAAHVVDRIGFWNAVGVTNLVQAYAPLVVSVGGAVALNNPDRVLDPIREHLETDVFNNVPEVRLTTLGDDVVLRGALAAALTDGTEDGSRRA